MFFSTLHSLKAATPSVEAEVDRHSVSVDDTLTLVVTVHGGGTMSSPDIPSQGHFDVVGRSMNTAVEIINGEMSMTKSFEFTLAPRSAGDFSIGPIKVYMEGQEFSAPPVTVHVTPSRANNGIYTTPGNPQTSFPTPQGFPNMPNFPNFPNYPNFPNPPTEATRPPSRGNQEYQDTFVTVETDRKDAYVGQQILFTFRLYSDVSIQNAQLTLPDFKDFITEELVQERKYQVELGGRRYLVNEWRLALFPTKSGTLSTGKTEVSGNVPVTVNNAPFGNDPFFQGFTLSMRPKTFSGNDIQIQVKPLPNPPADFSGLVGQFSMSSSLSKETLNLGETTNLSIEISGKGNIREATLPKMEGLDLFKVYSDQPTVKLEKNLQGLQGKKTFTFALVADRPGTTTVPPVEVTYFNPETNTFEKLASKSMTVAIKGSANQEQLITAGIKKTEDILTSKDAKPRDLEPLQSPTEILYSQALSDVGKGFAWGFLMAPPLGYLALLGFYRYQESSESHREDKKRSRAFRRAKHAILKLKIDQSPQGFSTLANLLREYLGDHFSIQGKAMTPIEFEDLLKSKNVRVEVVRRMAYILEQLDLWQYGGFKAELPAEKELKQEVLEILREVERSS